MAQVPCCIGLSWPLTKPPLGVAPSTFTTVYSVYNTDIENQIVYYTSWVHNDVTRTTLHRWYIFLKTKCIFTPGLHIFLLKNGSFRKPGRITVGLPSNLSTFFQRSKIWADEFAVRGTVVAEKNRLTSVCRLIFSSREALFKVRLFSVVTMVYRVVVSLIFFLFTPNYLIPILTNILGLVQPPTSIPW